MNVERTKPRIYADFHKTWERGQVILTCLGTLVDLRQLKIDLVEGLEVVLYMDDADRHGNPDDLEVDAVIRFHPDLGQWRACTEHCVS
jgi:hypothetical protein